ncbi:MAG: aminoglycoside phosphotransferase family protein [Promethearchaeia archaeon]
MSNSPTTIHGYEANRFIEMLRSKLMLELDGTIQFLGGNSNLNLLLKNDNDRYVLKVPALQIDYEENPYDLQWRVHEIAYGHRLSNKPVAKGKLDYELPFFVTEYEEGITKQEYRSFSDEELVAIRDSLSRFSDLRLPLPEYNNPTDYLNMCRKEIGQVESSGAKQRESLSDYLGKMKKIGNKLEQTMEEFPDWPADMMHGDFRPSNVILQETSVVLIDFENTCIGSSMYDLAYFFVEPPGSFGIPIETPLVKTRERQNIMLRFVPLALFSCLTWTIIRLVHLEMGIVEENLVSPDTQKMLDEYFRQKSKQLADVVEMPT